MRTPQLIVVGALTSTMFLLIFRYVFGGAIGTGNVSYVDFLIPGLAAAGAMFSGMGGAVGVAEDVAGGHVRPAAVAADPAVGGAARPLAGRHRARRVGPVRHRRASGFATGLPVPRLAARRRRGGRAVPAVRVRLDVAVHLMGLVAGSGQAANGMSMLAFPFVFVSSAYVPVESMPGWMQPVAEHQPVTPMIGAVRALALGDDAVAVLGHSAGWFAVRALLWSVADRRRLRPAGHAELRPALSSGTHRIELVAGGLGPRGPTAPACQTAADGCRAVGARVSGSGGRSIERGETVGVAEGSCGGLVSAALLAVPGASAYYAGGAVIYTLAANRAFLEGAIPTPPGLRGATEGFAAYLAASAVARLGSTWGIGEGGAAGPSGNRYGDPAGHAWLAVAGPGAGDPPPAHRLRRPPRQHGGVRDRRARPARRATRGLTTQAATVTP